MSLNLVNLLLLLVNFVSGFRLEFMYILLIISIRSHLTHSSPWFSAACAAAKVHRNHFFCLYQQNKSSESKVKFRQSSNCCKRVLKAAKVAYANKTNESITSQKHGSHDFWQIANSVLNKGKSAIPPLKRKKNFMAPFLDEVQLPQGYRATSMRQFTFYHKVPRNFCYSFDRPQKDEWLSQPWSHPVVFEHRTPGLVIQCLNH